MSDDVLYLILSFIGGFLTGMIILFFYYEKKISDNLRIHCAIHKAQGNQIDELCRIIGESGKVDKTGNKVVI